MKRSKEWERAAAVVAAASGIGIASGRPVVFFFAQMGRASWIGVLAASALFGGMCALVAFAASETGCRSFSGICRTLSGRWADAVYRTLRLSVAVAMLVQSGKLAMLALPVRHAFAIGVLAALGLSSLLCIKGMRAWGMLSIALCIVFFALLALDARPVRFAANYETVLKLRGSMTAALLLGTLHAMLCAITAAEEIASSGTGKPIRTALQAGGLMFLLLITVNAAFARGGERLISQPFPVVLLAARRGKAGYYGCILVKWMCILSTLNSILSALTGKTRKRRET